MRAVLSKLKAETRVGYVRTGYTNAQYLLIDQDSHWLLVSWPIFTERVATAGEQVVLPRFEVKRLWGTDE